MDRKRSKAVWQAGVAATVLLGIGLPPALACEKAAVTTVKAFYDQYVRDKIPNNFAPELYSARVRPVLEALLKRCEPDWSQDGCAIDGDFFIDGNDVRLTNLKVSCLAGDAQRSRVLVSFKNLGVRSEKVLDMVKEADGWRIDDIADGKAGKGYLMDLFKAP